MLHGDFTVSDVTTVYVAHSSRSIVVASRVFNPILDKEYRWVLIKFRGQPEKDLQKTLPLVRFAIVYLLEGGYECRPCKGFLDVLTVCIASMRLCDSEMLNDSDRDPFVE